MNRTSTWLCQSCRAPIGEVLRDGALQLAGPTVNIDHRGVARVTCQGCGANREWRPRERSGVVSRGILKG